MLILICMGAYIVVLIVMLVLSLHIRRTVKAMEFNLELIGRNTDLIGRNTKLIKRNTQLARKK